MATIKNTNGNILKVVSQYCNTTVKVISLVYYNNQASFIINISGNSSTGPSITSYTIPSVDINIEETSDNPISNKAVYNALKEVKNTIPTNYVTTDTEQTITGIKNFNDAIKIGNFNWNTYTGNIPFLTYYSNGVILKTPNGPIRIHAHDYLRLESDYDIFVYGSSIRFTTPKIYLYDNTTELNSTITDLQTRLKAAEDKITQLETIINQISVNV